MPRTAFVTHEHCLDHDTGLGHPERAARLRAVWDALDRSAVGSRLEHLQSEPAGFEAIDRVHRPAYRRWVEERCLKGARVLDSGDTVVCHDSFMVALLAAGAAVDATDAVLSGRADNAFAAVRPPGHHARPGAAMGFCLFNNVAVAAADARARHGVERVLIVDWDVHHGNGTQETFFDDPGVLFCSIHQSPFWPMTGFADERGHGAGEGLTINVPVAAGAGIGDYRAAFDRVLRPAADRFRPELVLLSAGWDAHRDDPLAGVELEDRDFRELGERVLAIAADHCDGRLVSVLEGGYDLGVLRRCVVDHLDLLSGSD